MEQNNNTTFFINSNCTVLIVDNEKINLELLGATLENENYKVECAPSGKQALQFFETNTADIILLDILMPDMDGFQVSKNL